MNEKAIAYCQELGRNVTIYEARAEFKKGHFQNFHFLCSDPNCWDGPNGPGVKIAGVNYKINATQSKKIKKDHFRDVSKHRFGCSFHQITVEDHINSVSNSKHINNQSKKDDDIQIYDPSGPKLTNRNVIENKYTTAINTALSSSIKNRNLATSQNSTETNKLADIVDYYLESKNNKDQFSYQNKTIKIKFFGEVYLKNYFIDINDLNLHSNFHQVIYAEATFIRNYGEGFLLSILNNKNKTIRLYISKDLIKNFKYKNNLRDLINKMNDLNCKATIYFQGSINFISNTYQIKIDFLEKLVVKLPEL